MSNPAGIRVTFRKESWALKNPFRFAGYTIASSDVVTVALSRGDFVGRGEATGVIYRGETPDTICADIAGIIPEVERGINQAELCALLPAGGARNAIDSALWDLECKESGKTIWQMLDLQPRPVTTVNTIGLDDLRVSAKRAAELAAYPLLKVKLDRNDPVGRVRAIRAVRPDARIVVDANQSWDIACLKDAVRPLHELGVEMIEQSLPAGQDDVLAGFHSPIALCADESCFTASDIGGLHGRYQMINIKLDKSGGFTEALVMVKQARATGLGLMIGNMIGTSLSMAPSFVIAQFCSVVDLDGPLALIEDRPDGLNYEMGRVLPYSRDLWG
jgi:L-alanine-DL-glutamate epimerase-like enolase superfamily enzyme